jgi:hypothetical protein
MTENLSTPSASSTELNDTQDPIILFGMSRDDVYERYPSVKGAREMLEEFGTRMQQDATSLDTSANDDNTEREQSSPIFSRRENREARPHNATWIKIIRSAVHTALDNENREDGVKDVETVLREASLDADMYEDLFKPFMSKLPHISKVFGSFRAYAASARGDITTSLQGTPDDKYELIKIAGLNAYTEVGGQESSAWKAGRMLLGLCAIADIQPGVQLKAELSEGRYDHHIAKDVMRYIEQDGVLDADLVKIKQLGQFATAIAGGGTEMMANSLEVWPADQRHTIQQLRNALMERITINQANAVRWLQEKEMLPPADPKSELESRALTLIEDILKRVPITAEDKPYIMACKATIKSKRRRKHEQRLAEQQATHSATVAASAEKSEESLDPYTMMTVDLGSQESLEGVDYMVDAFLEGLGQQGDTKLREDVDKMFTYLARRDLPTTHRRGKKKLDNCHVRYKDGGEEKRWQLWEFKPTEAAGLSLRSGTAKDSRIYYVELNDDTLGIVGFEPRSKQEEFLKSVRLKTKRRD